MPGVPPNLTSRVSRRGWLVAVALAAVCSVRAAPSTPAGPPSAPADAPPPVAAPAVVQAPWVHGYASYGEPKYPRGFDHFGYVNPTAPKGGTHDAALKKFDAQLQALCTRLDAADGQRATCDALLKPEAKKDA